MTFRLGRQRPIENKEHGVDPISFWRDRIVAFLKAPFFTTQNRAEMEQRDHPPVEWRGSEEGEVLRKRSAEVLGPLCVREFPSNSEALCCSFSNQEGRLCEQEGPLRE